MTVNEFARTLAKELAARGVGRDEAIKHSAALVRTFSREDLREVEDYGCADDFKELSDSLAALIFSRVARERKAAEKSADAAVSAQTAMNETETAAETETESAAETETDNAAGTDISTDTAAETDGGKVCEPDRWDGAEKGGRSDKTEIVEPEKPEAQSADDRETAQSVPTSDTVRINTAVIGSTRAFDTVRAEGAPTGTVTAPTSVVSVGHSEERSVAAKDIADGDTQEIYLDEETSPIREKTVLTSRGKVFFWVITVLTSPLWICCGALVMCVFGIAVAAVCAFMAACICLVCAEAAAGGAVALVGIIYGISRIFTGSPAAGIFEIGLGIAVGGVALALGILTYNFAVVVLPGLLRQLISFEGYCLRRIPPALDRFREECNRL
ncbi:MAG: hypothetical protein ACI4SJ_06465 [Candidatus Avispirillum sp.]